MIATEVCGDNEVPNEGMYHQMEYRKIARLAGFKYFDIHITDKSMMNSLVANCENTALIDAIISILHKYESMSDLIATVKSEISNPINAIVRKQILGN